MSDENKVTCPEPSVPGTEDQGLVEVIIDVSTFEPHFRDEIVAEPGGEHIRRCFSCSTCTAGCPVAGVTDKYNPRRIVHMALLGMREQVLTSDFVWLCSVCYTCYERCPQDVRIPELMNAVRNIAVREGFVPQTFKMQMEKLEAHGRLYEIEDYENERRADYGLPPIREEAEEVCHILRQAPGPRSLGPRAQDRSLRQAQDSVLEQVDTEE